MKKINIWLDIQSHPPNFKVIEEILSEKTTDLNFSIREIHKDAYVQVSNNVFSTSSLESFLKEDDESLVIAFTYVKLDKSLHHTQNLIIKQIISDGFNEVLVSQLIYIAYCILEKPLTHFDSKTKNNQLLSPSSLKNFTTYNDFLNSDETATLGRITYEKAPSQIFVALTHGIRTHAEWAEPAKNVLFEHRIQSGNPTRYDWVDTIKFATVLSVRKEYAKIFLKDIIDSKKNNPRSRLCISVHSYGSIVLTEALELARDLRISIEIDSIILSGSILPTNFNWEQYTNKKNTVSVQRVLNICGSKDFWPVLAKYFAKGDVGYSGTFYLSGPSNITNIRINNEGHAGILDRKYVEKIWVQYLQNGHIDAKGYEGGVSFRVNLCDHLLRLTTFIKYPVIIYLLYKLLEFIQIKDIIMTTFPFMSG